MDLLTIEMGKALRKPLPPARRYFTLTLLLFLLVTGSLYAQDFAGQNWYFGNNNQGIRFTRPDNDPTLVTTPANLAIGASAVATDPANGNLLFYTDGVNVY